MEALANLTASVVKMGVQQPGIVRKLPALRGLAAYELVAGERRWRASRQADLAHFPAIIRELDDAEVLEIQLVENLQRETLHPLEEAAGYEELMKVAKLTAEQVGEKVGLSRSWVYSRLNLLKLPKEAQDALQNGGIDVSRALIVASVADPDRRGLVLEKALERNMDNNFRYSVRQLRAEIVKERQTFPLRGAPFPTGDATLLPKAGDCGRLPVPHRQLRPGRARSRRLHQRAVLPPQGEGQRRPAARRGRGQGHQGPQGRGGAQGLAVREDRVRARGPRPGVRTRRLSGSRAQRRRLRQRQPPVHGRLARARGGLAAADLPRTAHRPEVFLVADRGPQNQGAARARPVQGGAVAAEEAQGRPAVLREPHRPSFGRGGAGARSSGPEDSAKAQAKREAEEKKRQQEEAIETAIAARLVEQLKAKADGVVGVEELIYLAGLAFRTTCPTPSAARSSSCTA